MEESRLGLGFWGPRVRVRPLGAQYEGPRVNVRALGDLGLGLGVLEPRVWVKLVLSSKEVYVTGLIWAVLRTFC